MDKIKKYSFVKHKKYDFGIVMHVDSFDDSALVVYFERHFSSFNPVLSCWAMVNSLEIIEKNNISKEMCHIKEKAKETSFYYDFDDCFNKPFLWKITEDELIMFFKKEKTIEDIIEDYKNYHKMHYGDIRIYK